jgi:hypothetical protein
LNDFSDEDTNGGRDSDETAAKRPNLSESANSVSPTPHNNPLDLSAFSSGFTHTNKNFMSTPFNWDLPLSVAVSQNLPVSLASVFSPQLLPKTKPPSCEALV